MQYWGMTLKLSSENGHDVAILLLFLLFSKNSIEHVASGRYPILILKVLPSLITSRNKMFFFPLRHCVFFFPSDLNNVLLLVCETEKKKMFFFFA